MKTLLRLCIILALAGLPLACDDTDELKTQEMELLEAYLEDNNITTPPTESGLYYLPGRSGVGKEVASGDTVVMHFEELLLKNGKLIESTLDSGPYQFVYKQDELVAGLEEGLGYMRGGESAVFIIPSGLAYGSVQNGPIPPYSTLIFEIYLLDVR